MKIKFTAAAAIVFCLATIAVAQGVVITPKKTTYKRSKPIMDFKRTFTITRPIVKASTPALSKKIMTAISYERVLKLDLKEELGEYQWLEEARYKVGYNKNSVLSIELSMNGTAAYPDDVTKTVVVDISKGVAVKPADVFVNLPKLAAMIKKAQQAEIKTAIAEIKADPENADARPEELFEDADFKVEDLKEFSVGAKGVTFIYDYGFPHVLQGLQPTGNFAFTWNQLRPFIKRSGLLARFVP
jgi:hypothetical protein